jgi:hypothetical protein
MRYWPSTGLTSWISKLGSLVKTTFLFQPIGGLDQEDKTILSIALGRM